MDHQKLFKLQFIYTMIIDKLLHENSARSEEPGGKRHEMVRGDFTDCSGQKEMGVWVRCKTYIFLFLIPGS